MQQQMKVRPDRAQIESRILQNQSLQHEFSTGWTEDQQIEMSEDVEELYSNECKAFAQGVTNDVHMLLSAISPLQIDMDGHGAGNPVGLAIVHNIVAKIEHLS